MSKSHHHVVPELAGIHEHANHEKVILRPFAQVHYMHLTAMVRASDLVRSCCAR